MDQTNDKESSKLMTIHIRKSDLKFAQNKFKACMEQNGNIQKSHSSYKRLCTDCIKKTSMNNTKPNFPMDQVQTFIDQISTNTIINDGKSNRVIRFQKPQTGYDRYRTVFVDPKPTNKNSNIRVNFSTRDKHRNHNNGGNETQDGKVTKSFNDFQCINCDQVKKCKHALKTILKPVLEMSDSMFNTIDKSNKDNVGGCKDSYRVEKKLLYELKRCKSLPSSSDGHKTSMTKRKVNPGRLEQEEELSEKANSDSDLSDETVDKKSEKSEISNEEICKYCNKRKPPSQSSDNLSSSTHGLNVVLNLICPKDDKRPESSKSSTIRDESKYLECSCYSLDEKKSESTSSPEDETGSEEIEEKEKSKIRSDSKMHRRSDKIEKSEKSEKRTKSKHREEYSDRYKGKVRDSTKQRKLDKSKMDRSRGEKLKGDKPRGEKMRSDIRKDKSRHRESSKIKDKQKTSKSSHSKHRKSAYEDKRQRRKSKHKSEHRERKDTKYERTDRDRTKQSKKPTQVSLKYKAIQTSDNDFPSSTKNSTGDDSSDSRYTKETVDFDIEENKKKPSVEFFEGNSSSGGDEMSYSKEISNEYKRNKTIKDDKLYYKENKQLSQDNKNKIELHFDIGKTKDQSNQTSLENSKPRFIEDDARTINGTGKYIDQVRHKNENSDHPLNGIGKYIDQHRRDYNKKDKCVPTKNGKYITKTKEKSNYEKFCDSIISMNNQVQKTQYNENIPHNDQIDGISHEGVSLDHSCNSTPNAISLTMNAEDIKKLATLFHQSRNLKTCYIFENNKLRIQKGLP